MDDRTLEALYGSIRKWEAIVAGEGVDEGPDNCPLCLLFYAPALCRRCPVYQKTGASDCVGTPYIEWHKWAELLETSTVFARPDDAMPDPLGVRLAQAEVDFLKSLLPPEAPS